MILIVTNRSDYTADFVILRLNELGIQYVRFNTEDFPFNARVSLSLHEQQLELEKSSKRLNLSEVSSVWYRRPEGPFFPPDFDSGARDFVTRESRECLLGIWRTLTCLWVNNPDRIRLAENKVEQLTRMRNMGLAIPKTLITNDPEQAKKFYQDCNGNAVAKTLRQSHGKDGHQEYVIYTSALQNEHLSLFDTIRFSPVIFQERLQKSVDIRVTVVKSEVFATEIHSQEGAETQVDWRTDTLSLKHVVHKLPEHIEDQCLKLVKSYGLAFGAIDLVRTPNSGYVFLELNPNGQWAWIEAITQQPISMKLIEVLTSGESSG